MPGGENEIFTFLKGLESKNCRPKQSLEIGPCSEFKFLKPQYITPLPQSQTTPEEEPDTAEPDVGVRIRRTVIQVRREHARIHAIVPVTAAKNRTGRVAVKIDASVKIQASLVTRTKPFLFFCDNQNQDLTRHETSDPISPNDSWAKARCGRLLSTG